MNEMEFRFVHLLWQATHYGEVAEWLDAEESLVVWKAESMARAGIRVPRLLPGLAPIDIRALWEIVQRISEGNADYAIAESAN